MDSEAEEPPPAKKAKTTKDAGTSAKKAEGTGTEKGGMDGAAAGEASASEDDSSDDDAAIPTPQKSKQGTAQGTQLFIPQLFIPAYGDFRDGTGSRVFRSSQRRVASMQCGRWA